MEDSERKEITLANVEYLVGRGLVSGDELLAVLQRVKPESSPASEVRKDVLKRKVHISDILYSLGSLTIITGLIILVGQQWSEMSSFTKTLVTLGSGVAAFTVGVLFSSRSYLEKIAQAFHVIAAAVLPLGLYVIFDIGGVDTGSPGFQIAVPLILTAVYTISLFVFKERIFIFFITLFSTWLYYAIVYNLTEGLSFSDSLADFYMYATLLAGAAYLFLAHGLMSAGRTYFNSFLNFFGAWMLLGGGFALTFNNPVWELIYPGLVFGVSFSSIKLKSRSLLGWGSLFFMTYIISITARHFADTIGWPTALILAGFMLMIIGFSTYRLGKKYIPR